MYITYYYDDRAAAQRNIDSYEGYRIRIALQRSAISVTQNPATKAAGFQYALLNVLPDTGNYSTAPFNKRKTLSGFL